MIRVIYYRVLDASPAVSSPKYSPCPRSEVIETRFPLAEYKQARDSAHADVEQATSQRVLATSESDLQTVNDFPPDIYNRESNGGARRTAT
jgi:hypothetical protein